ncbi:protein tyrosine phosphatase [bacterium F16]|nr:protein tyrosine phosphatase [bacterium F16]
MPTTVLFVCLGNICRSPTAEGVMQKLVDDNTLSHDIHIDSAGTGGWHVGDRADSRMRGHAIKRGIELTSIGRQIKAGNLKNFDYIIGMDDSNIQNIKRLDTSGTFDHKIFRMVDFCSRISCSEVPDPYYGGEAGFELVIDILEDACDGLLKKVRAEQGL